MMHKTTRSILSVLLAVLLLVASTPLTPAFAGGGGAVSLQSESGEGGVLKGDGTAGNPYKIATADDLLEFAKLVNNKGETTANAILTADIDLNNRPWYPIGSESRPYSGTFNGDGHTISGLNINNSTADDQGLFGYVSGTVQNLTVDGTVSGSGNYVGGVVGYNSSGTVTNCAFSGSVSGNNYVGGVVGLNRGSVINCTNTGSVKGSGIYVGGVVGWNSSDANVTNCYNTGAVSGPDSGSGNSVGGVVGCNSGIVTNCYNTGSVTSSGSPVGGVVGDNGGSVENSYNTGAVSGGEDVGGVVGQNSDSSAVENCYNTGSVKGDWYVGGVVGDNSGPVKNCYNTGTVTGPDSVSGSYVGGVVGWNDSSSGSVTNCYFLTGTAESGIGSDASEPDETAVDDLNDQEQFQGWDFDNTWRISTDKKHPVLQANAEDNALSGTGKQEDPYKIYRTIDLKNFRDLVNDENGQTADTDAHAKLMNNIDLNGNELDQWTPIGNSSNEYSGTFNGDGHTISGLYINDSSDSYQGLFGYVGSSGKVQNLSVSGKVSGNNYVGGVVGDNRGSVEDCDFTGSVTGTVDYVGGVVGYNGGTVKNCYNTGNTSGNSVGGIVGRNSGTVENCYNTGNISGDISIGISGGVVGWNDSGTVKNCYNTGNISGNTSGGVVGYNHSGGSVTNSYNTGAVSGDEEVGGVVGWNDGGSVTTSYNTGEVSGNRSVGGVVGLNSSSTVTGCYFLQTADVNVGRPGIGGGSGTSGNVEARTADAFHSGEVAYLLQNGQKAAEGGVVPLVWGQSNLNTDKSWPTLVALNPDAAKKVYQLTFDWHYEGAPEGTTTTTNVYTNGSVAIPEINHDRAGYHISGWKDASGAPVTTETAVTADTIYTAEWTANTYTITVTAGSGGTVSGGGNVTHGDSVEVTATANQGYHFVNWTENGTEVSTSATYSFTATANRTLTANFAADAVEPTPTPTPDPTPSGPSTGDSTGWDDILDELENTENGDEITIDMGDETKVPAEIFESLAGKDVEISFDLGDIQWSVNGADIPTDTDFTDLDLGVNLDTSGIPVNVINTITGEVGTVQITLAHDGEFGFTMTLTAPLGKENAGYWANLYHYDEEAEAMNFEVAAKIDEDGSVTIPFSHASQYAIVIDTHSHATVDVSDIFIDVAPDAWYKDAIQYAYDHGLMTGVSDTEFAPEATTTRAMIVSILARLEGVTTAQAAGFADVDDNDWYATAVNWAANVGVVNGYEDNTFRPNQPITREQLAAILMNYASYKGEDVSNRADLTSYTDQPSTWAEEAMQWAVAEGLISGVTNDQLQPQSSATRAQVAAILQRLLEA